MAARNVHERHAAYWSHAAQHAASSTAAVTPTTVPPGRSTASNSQTSTGAAKAHTIEHVRQYTEVSKCRG